MTTSPASPVIEQATKLYELMAPQVMTLVQAIPPAKRHATAIVLADMDEEKIRPVIESLTPLEKRQPVQPREVFYGIANVVHLKKELAKIGIPALDMLDKTLEPGHVRMVFFVKGGFHVAPLSIPITVGRGGDA